MPYIARLSSLSHDKNLWLSSLIGRVIFHFSSPSLSHYATIQKGGYLDIKIKYQ